MSTTIARLRTGHLKGINPDDMVSEATHSPRKFSVEILRYFAITAALFNIYTAIPPLPPKAFCTHKKIMAMVNALLNTLTLCYIFCTFGHI